VREGQRGGRWPELRGYRRYACVFWGLWALWESYGVPRYLYTDAGSDFTSAHIDPLIDVTRKAGVEQIVLGSGARDKAHQGKECDRLIPMYQLRPVGWL
jgi:hypothetical protein